tara:strand:- start:399 stop:623 length:225 start_codon:yes stop_codon:yes gene_type:complete
MSKSMFYMVWSDAGEGYAIQFDGFLFGEEVKNKHIAFFSSAENANRFVDDMNRRLNSDCAEECLCGGDFKEAFQ